MIKLGVFGDSWADPGHGHKGYPELDSFAWPNQLGKPVVNYARAGSSLYASYRLFLDHHADYEQVIFVVTSVGRLPLNQVTTKFGVTWAISNADTAQHFLRDRADEFGPLELTRLQAMFGYYLWLVDYDYEYHAAHLILERIRRLRPDSLIIPAFNQAQLFRGTTSLADWLEPTIRGLDSGLLKNLVNYGGVPYREQRCCCHLTPEANQSIAHAVSRALAQGTWGLEHVPDRIPHEHDMGYYWDLSQKTGAFAT
jgi:hypothetical protein